MMQVDNVRLQDVGFRVLSLGGKFLRFEGINSVVFKFGCRAFDVEFGCGLTACMRWFGNRMKGLFPRAIGTPKKHINIMNLPRCCRAMKELGILVFRVWGHRSQKEP